MKLPLSILLVCTTIFFFGCEKDDGSPTNPNTYTPTDSTWSDSTRGYNVRLNATSYSSYRYYSLANHDMVSISDAQASVSNNWELAFRRYYGKINGGASGGAGLRAVDLASLSISDSVNFEGVTVVPMIADSLWQEDELTLAIADSAWWYYTGPPNHLILATRQTFVLKTASGKYAKMVIDSLAGSTRTSAGILTVKFVYQADGMTHLNGVEQLTTLDATANPAYFSFASGGAVSVADPMMSQAWDFVVDGFSIRLNSAASGPGMAASIKSDTTFNATLEAPVGPPYSQDMSVSVFGTESLDPWFNYNQQHELISKRHVYVVRTSANLYYKLQIENYYMVVGGASQGGWMQFRYKQL